MSQQVRLLISLSLFFLKISYILLFFFFKFFFYFYLPLERGFRALAGLHVEPGRLTCAAWYNVIICCINIVTKQKFLYYTALVCSSTLAIIQHMLYTISFIHSCSIAYVTCQCCVTWIYDYIDNISLHEVYIYIYICIYIFTWCESDVHDITHLSIPLHLLL